MTPSVFGKQVHNVPRVATLLSRSEARQCGQDTQKSRSPPTGNFYSAREPRKPYREALQLKENIRFNRNIPHSAANLRKFMAQSRSAGSSGPGRVKVKTARSFVHLGTKRWDLDDDLDHALDSIPG